MDKGHGSLSTLTDSTLLHRSFLHVVSFSLRSDVSSGCMLLFLAYKRGTVSSLFFPSWDLSCFHFHNLPVKIHKHLLLHLQSAPVSKSTHNPCLKDYPERFPGSLHPSGKRSGQMNGNVTCELHFPDQRGRQIQAC
jgi:hypothetical protein